MTRITPIRIPSIALIALLAVGGAVFAGCGVDAEEGDGDAGFFTTARGDSGGLPAGGTKIGSAPSPVGIVIAVDGPVSSARSLGGGTLIDCESSVSSNDPSMADFPIVSGRNVTGLPALRSSSTQPCSRGMAIFRTSAGSWRK